MNIHTQSILGNPHPRMFLGKSIHVGEDIFSTHARCHRVELTQRTN